MADRPSVLDLLESKTGSRIVGGELSQPLQGRIIELQRAMARIDSLRIDIEALNRQRTNYLVILFASLAFGAFGVIIGLTGFLQGFLGALGASLSIVASIGILVFVYYLALMDNSLHTASLVKIVQVARLSVDFDARLEDVSREVVSEVTVTRTPRNNSAYVPWPKGE